MVDGVESGRKIKEAKKDKTTMPLDHGYTVGLFQLSDACSRHTSERCEDHWRQDDQ